MVDPLAIRQLDVSRHEVKRALVWTKILPFVMLIWALTGAFYPAIDLCAGEKERGTLETLLCSPARRKEIVWGKLLTIMCFSIGTALLNLASMHTTTSIVMTQFSQLGATDMVASLGPLPLHSMGWLILLVIPSRLVLWSSIPGRNAPELDKRGPVDLGHSGGNHLCSGSDHGNNAHPLRSKGASTASTAPTRDDGSRVIGGLLAPNIYGFCGRG